MKKIVLAAAVSAALSPAAFAADPMTIVITASRTEQAVANVTAPVTVITKDDIEQQQPKSVAEALTATPGIQIKSSGGYGQESSIFLRGVSQDRMLVLVDGVQIGSATLGETSLQHLSMDQIERIEVVRGARSSLYGANAIGGVIQIFTKQPKQEQSYAEILGGYGSNNTVQSAVSGGWANSQSQISAKVSHFSTDGFDVMPEKSAGGIDDDGYTNNSLKLDGQHDFGRHTVSAGLQYTAGENDFDDSYGGSNDRKTEFEYSTAYVGLESKLTDSFTLTGKISNYKDDTLTIVDGDDGDNFVTKTQKLEIQGEQKYSGGLLAIAGFDYKKDDISESSQDYAETERDNKAAFALIEKTGNNYQAALSARVDDNEAFGDFTTYGIDGQYDLTSKVSLSAGYATAFQTPTFNDLYYPGGSGNPDVMPEKSETASVGIQFTPKHNLSFEFSAYNTQIDDMIAWAPTTANESVWKPSNVNSVEITGAEFLANASFGSTQLIFNANLLDTEDKKTEKQLIYRAQKTANLRISQQHNQLTVGLDTQFTDERYTNSSNTEKLPAYTLYNLDAKYRLNKQLNLSASVKNLTDKEYATNKGYATAGRTVFGSVRYRF